ncbi:hypothetical protein [Halopiger xanaduensis]|uniref:ABC-2 type transport system permease protein n=1 Tax=Halopiger xanaduensis (strain DSM 18323 / JCM 14033 / SH-6) TaxID=797210 RepID=F8D9S5_HALXS|nr:hypothetical protein [Halopiger xanaduensis]AEH37793.1 hypothetical protein Halxa_3180 [Halopiger xanaduensis SH-6]
MTADARSGASTRAVFLALAREEWRLHARLFGGWRFGCFPLVVAALTAAGAFALVETGTAAGTVVTGLHVLAFGFGLYSGTAALAGSSMLENVFGRLSLVLSTAATLPLSRRRLLGLFLLKDTAFYGLVFVLPMAIAAVPLEVLTSASELTTGATLSSAAVAVLALWLSLSLVFAVGTVATVGLIAVRTRGVPTWAIGLGIGLVAIAAWQTGWVAAASDRAALVPLNGSFTGAAGLAAAAVLSGVAALAIYDPTYGKPSRTAGDRFGTISDALPLETDALVAKTLLELARSAGGVWKPFVSAGILFALVAALVGVVESITGIAPAPGIFFGGVLGLSAFTTYNWLTQFDSLETYLAYPIPIEDVFRAKRTAFVLVGAPTVAVPYLAAILWFDATLVDAVAGALVLAGYALYYYGLTVYLAGFDPNEFLFDAVRFSAFTAGVAVPLVPTLVAGFVDAPPSPMIAAALGAAGLAVGAVGHVLSSRAGPRWDERYRDGAA